MTNPPTNPWQQGQPEMNPPADSLGQPAADPYGQPAANPYGAPEADPYGQAYPAYGQPAGRTANLAGWFKRVVASIIDNIPSGILSGIGSYFGPQYASNYMDPNAPIPANDGEFRNVALWALFALLSFAFTFWNRWYRAGKTGQSIGKSAMGIKLVGEADGQPIGILRAFLRDILHFLDAIVCYLGFLWPLWDTKKQTFSDKIMKTVVIDER